MAIILYIRLEVRLELLQPILRAGQQTDGGLETWLKIGWAFTPQLDIPCGAEIRGENRRNPPAMRKTPEQAGCVSLRCRKQPWTLIAWKQVHQKNVT